MKPRVCLQCQKELPDNYEGRYCPHCGVVFAITVVSPPPPSPQKGAFKMNWLIFFAVFLAAPLLTSIVAFLGREHSDDGFSPVVGFFGGGACGIASGILLALRVGKTSNARVLLSVLFSIVFAIVCIMLSCFGCMAAGYKLNLH